MQQHHPTPSRWQKFKIKLQSWRQPPDALTAMALSLKNYGWLKDQYFTHTHEAGKWIVNAYQAMDGRDMKDAAGLAKHARKWMLKIIDILGARMEMPPYQIRVCYFNRNKFALDRMEIYMTSVGDGKIGQIDIVRREPSVAGRNPLADLPLFALKVFPLDPGHFFIHFYSQQETHVGDISDTLAIIKILSRRQKVTPPPDRRIMVKDLANILPSDGIYQKVSFRFIAQHNGQCVKTAEYALWPD